jgi:hypothetical protein
MSSGNRSSLTVSNGAAGGRGGAAGSLTTTLECRQYGKTCCPGLMAAWPDEGPTLRTGQSQETELAKSMINKCGRVDPVEPDMPTDPASSSAPAGSRRTPLLVTA